MTPLLAASLLLLSPAAQAASGGGGGPSGAVFKDVCDPTVRTAADDVACICAKKATAAESVAAKTGADPDYTSWWSGFTFDGGLRSVSGVNTSASTPVGRANDSCFDLIEHITTSTTMDVRNGYVEALVGFAETGAGLHSYGYHVLTSDNDSDYVDDFVDGLAGFGAEGTVSRRPPKFPPIIIDELDPFTTELRTEEMGPTGTVDTQGRDIAGGFLQDVNGDQQLDAVIFLEDGGNFVLESVAPHMHYILPMQ